MKTITVQIPVAEAMRILELPIKDVPVTITEIVKTLTPAEVGRLLEQPHDDRKP